MLAKNKKIWTLGAAILLVAGMAYVHAAEVVQNDGANRDAALVAAAQKTYDQLMKLYSRGQFGNQDEIYVWSRRVLEAENRAGRGNARALLDAAKAHENRVQQLNEIRSKAVENGLTFTSPASEFYLLEAQALVADASHGQ